MKCIRHLPLLLGLLLCLTSPSLRAASSDDSRISATPQPARLKTSSAPSLEIPANAQRQLNQFFSTLQSGNSKLAFLNLFDKTQFKEDTEIIENFITASQGSIERFGPYKKFAPFETTRIGSRLYLLSYISEQGTKLFRWQFLYFTPIGNEWRLANIRVDDMREYMPAQPNPVNPPKEVALKIEKFFITIQSNRSPDAFKELLTGSSIDSTGPNVDGFVQRTEKAIKEYGAMKNYELFDHRPLTPEFSLLIYFSHLETEPLRWHFYFETKGEAWKLINLRVDDSLDEGILNN
ncbi:MAG: hypothetical protein HC904_01070 [Blastochloris sp.]|nr:hypothetical protein [Blastochloris sp.]